MSLSSFFQRLLRRGPAIQAPAAESLPPSQADIEATRTRARRRLIGMAVLVGAGVIGFPWLFETQPRPMSSEVEVVQAGAPRASGDPAPVSGRAVAGKVGVAGIVTPPSAEVVEPTPAAVEQEVTEREVVESPAETARDTAGAKEAERKQPEQKAAEQKLAAEKAADQAAAKRLAAEKEKAAEAARVRRLAEQKAADQKAAELKAAEQKAAERRQAEARAAASKPADKTDGGRYIVQVGAFGEAAKAQEVRQKVERLGIKTYTQVVETPDGKRIRVRIGPYADKAEAEKAMASLRKAGLGGNILTL